VKHAIRAGTDGAAICAFDPAALPADIDARCGDDPIGVMTQLAAAGRLWCDATAGDGAFGVHVFVDAPGDAAGLPRGATFLDIPSGDLWVCGAEYLASDPLRGHAFTPKGGLGRYDMGRRINVAPGRYALDVAVIARPDPPMRPMPSAHWRQAGLLLMTGLGGIVALILGLSALAIIAITALKFLSGDPAAFANLRKLWGIPAAALASAALAWLGLKLGASVARSPAVNAADAEGDAYLLANPDFILRLQRIGDAAV